VPAREGADNRQALQEEIASRAYRFWTERGCIDGFDEEDWLRAEKELLSTGEDADP
jgi:hypothetical protein